MILQLFLIVLLHNITIDLQYRQKTKSTTAISIIGAMFGAMHLRGTDLKYQ